MSVFRFFRLPLQDQLLLLKASVLLALIWLGLRVVGLQALRRRLAAQVSDSSIPPRDETYVRRVVWAVDVASRKLPGRITCLPRAMATQFLLARRGYPAQLRVGVAHDSQGKLEAHAWIEYGGSIIIGYLDDLTRYTLLPLV